MGEKGTFYEVHHELGREVYKREGKQSLVLPVRKGEER